MAENVKFKLIKVKKYQQNAFISKLINT